jgi:hypothetical protein
LGRGAAMELFRAERLGYLESNSTRKCGLCDDNLKLLRSIYYPETKATVRVFECKCGECTWDE